MPGMRPNKEPPKKLKKMEPGTEKLWRLIAATNHELVTTT